MEENNNVGIDKNFVDENGQNASVHIESATGYNVNRLNSVNFKLVNTMKKKPDLLGANKKGNLFTRDIGPKIKGTGFFTRDIGVKSSGFAQVASLAFIVALAGLFVMYIMFRY